MIRGSNFKHNIYFLQETDKGGKSEGGNIDFIDDGEGGAGAGNAPQKKRRAKRAGQPTLALEGIQNEELSALEAHMLRLSRLGKGYLVHFRLSMYFIIAFGWQLFLGF